MATKIRKSTSSKKAARFKRKKRIRAQIQGTAERPRLAVFRSNKHMYVQVIDDRSGKTIVAAGTIEGDLREKFSASIEGAKAVGALIAKRAISKNISKVVFDRAGYLYHGRIRALADAAREAGLQF